MTLARRPMAELANVALALSLAMAFVFWVVRVTPAQLADPLIGFARYWPSLMVAAPIAIAATLGLKFAAVAPWLLRVAAGLAGFYVGYVFGFVSADADSARWFGVAAAAMALFALRGERIDPTASLLVVHMIGSLTSIYIVLNVDRLQPDIVGLRNVLTAFWWLITK